MQQAMQPRHSGNRGQREETAAGHRDEPFFRGGLDHRKAGEAAEGGQDRASSAEYEAGQARRLEARALDPGAGVDVAAQRVAARWLLRHVTEQERRHGMRLGDHGDVPLRGRIARLGVVIAAHQGQREIAVRGAPRPKGGIERTDASARCMQEIAQDEELLRTRAREQRAQALQVMGGRTARHRHTRGTKGGALSEMNIGDEKRALARPVQRALDEQLHPLAAERYLERIGFAQLRASPRQIASRLHGPAPTNVKYRNTKQYSTAESRWLRSGRNARGACAIQYATAISPARMNATGRVNRPSNN